MENEDEVRHNFVVALNNHDIETVKKYTVNTGRLPPNYIISNRSLIEIATNFTNFECWKVIFDYSGGDINNMPKGLEPFNILMESGSNIDSRIFSFVASLPVIDKVKFVNYALYNAVSACHFDTMMTILKTGIADASIGLHPATVLCNSAVEILLAHGADINYVDGSGMNCITFACLRERTHPLIYARLKDNSNAIYVEIYNNNLQAIRNLAQMPLMRNFTWDLLPLPLLVAVQYANKETIQLCVQLFGNIDIRNPPHAQANRKLGGCENIVNALSYRPFDRDLFEYVMSLGASNDCVANDLNCVAYSVRQSDYEKTKFFLSKGCSPNVCTSLGTALHNCVYCCYSKENTSMMILLLQFGGDLLIGYPESCDYKPYIGMNTIDLALRQGKPNPRGLQVPTNNMN
jgi:ankyrin repeat protein